MVTSSDSSPERSIKPQLPKVESWSREPFGTSPGFEDTFEHAPLRHSALKAERPHPDWCVGTHELILPVGGLPDQTLRLRRSPRMAHRGSRTALARIC